jgi:hypothetical protein
MSHLVLPSSGPAMPMSFSRRDALNLSALGLGGLALNGFTGAFAGAAQSSLTPQTPHHEPKARRVIFLFMHGGPSQVDTFDHKPLLDRDDGKDLPFEKAARIDATPKLLKSPWKFARHGECGQWVSELLPHTAKHVDAQPRSVAWPGRFDAAYRQR